MYSFPLMQVTVASPHDKILAAAAKRALQPLGFRRKGQSRTWIRDHVWWLTVVEFQPSGFRKGSYLNVAAHWLWNDQSYISFDFSSNPDRGSRVASFEDYVSDEQFEQAACQLATKAAQEARELAERLPSLQTTAEILLKQETSLTKDRQGGWSAFHAGVAAALAGRPNDARMMFMSITDERVSVAAGKLTKLLSEPEKLKGEITSLIVNHRIALRLPELNSQPF